MNLFPSNEVTFRITQEKINESHHMENAWDFPSISHSMGKCNKTHRMGEPGKLVIILFP